MHKLFTILSLIILASCSKHVVPGTNTVTNEITTVDTVFVQKDTVIVVPGERVVIREQVPCNDVVFHKQATSASGKMKATVSIEKGHLDVDCQTDSLEARIKWLEAHSKKLVVKETTITVTHPPVRYIPKWVWWLMFINIGYVGLKIYAAKINRPLPF